MLDAVFHCAYCSRSNAIVVDPSQGLNQIFGEECEYCDHMNSIHLTIDPDTLEVYIETRCDDHQLDGVDNE